jgi:hypothetical protein
VPEIDPKRVIIPCSLPPERAGLIERFADELMAAAHRIGTHGLSEEEFRDSRILQAAIEKLRGRTAASTAEKHVFLKEILHHLQAREKIAGFGYTGAADRHDYEIKMLDGRVAIFEAKGCLDGNNTNIFQRPQNADEFFIWSLCQNPGADPKHNAWSGIHTRLGGTIIAEKEPVNGLVIWDMLCGTAARPCPKKLDRFTTLASGRAVPPPCIYLFPRTIPDPRNNPEPMPWQLGEVEFLQLLYDEFKCTSQDVIEVRLKTRMEGANVQRRTVLSQGAVVVAESDWTTLRRASR